MDHRVDKEVDRHGMHGALRQQAVLRSRNHYSVMEDVKDCDLARFPAQHHENRIEQLKVLAHVVDPNGADQLCVSACFYKSPFGRLYTFLSFFSSV